MLTRINATTVTLTLEEWSSLEQDLAALQADHIATTQRVRKLVYIATALSQKVYMTHSNRAVQVCRCCDEAAPYIADIQHAAGCPVAQLREMLSGYK